MLKKRIGQIIAIIFFVGLLSLAFLLIRQKEESLPPIGRRDLQISPSLEAGQSTFKEALFYEQLSSGFVECNLCPNNCILANKQIGACRARQNQEGKLVSLVYGEVAAKHVDPIEKKPLYHFFPGARAYSIATAGCNLSCKNCQNWDLSQKFPWEVKSTKMTPEQVVQGAIDSGAPIIAYTYSEPTIFYEFMLDAAKLAREKGIKNIMHSAGYINQEPLMQLIPYLDAANIDLKGFRGEFYKKLTNGDVGPVLETLKTLHQEAVWLEITYLIIPTYNDSEQEIKEMVIWVKENLDENVPIHFSRFFPYYKLSNMAATPIETIQRARGIALEQGLKYVYTGNVNWVEGNTTYCDDGSIAIERKGYFVSQNNLDDGKCGDGKEVAGVWE
ncbi:AmmeMemoRadiSam system radical SAM enzyme [Patescibacteria group bacterium]|nr:AmmeMemoRadiSam system radical SAM enzyme [Patescibacteria group bacterium]MBU4512244.1 AmmeMemoRadiSam system radical SAM enzyme [Patescibacteria group bacterium]MCG2692662.1 AmmeMemoRadiSam system radical SAM enzyme [Candidatus Parcubacteria bacterium]